jgi:hypothetical protein
MKGRVRVFVVLTVVAMILAIPGIAWAHHPAITADPDCVMPDGTWDFDYTITAATTTGATFDQLHNTHVEVWLLWNGVEPWMLDQTGAFTAANSNSFTGSATAPAGTDFVIIRAIPGEWADGYDGGAADIREYTVYEPELCYEPPGTGTPGYWKNHLDAWPVDEIVIGGITYTKAEAIEWMETPVKGDKTLTMFPQLVSAVLNVTIGNPSSCIADTIADAQAWMTSHPVGSGVKANSDAWDVGGPLAWMLDQYNNGNLCAPHRD